MLELALPESALLQQPGSGPVLLALPGQASQQLHPAWVRLQHPGSGLSLLASALHLV